MKRYLGARIKGIPPAPPVQVAFHGADKWFDDMKVALAHKLPFLTPEEVDIKSKPYHETRLQNMLLAGYHSGVEEFQSLLKKEQRERREHKHKYKAGEGELLQDREKVKRILDVLSTCQEYHDKGNYVPETLLRKEVGERFLTSGDVWLAKHFFFSALEASEKIQSKKEKERFQAEIHCLLAFLVRENSDNMEEILDAALNHLAICRKLSKGQPWQFKPNVLNIRLKKPITLHGIREEFAIIDACAMTLYMIATLLEHEILIGIANHIIKPLGHHPHHGHHGGPDDEGLKKAYEYANYALKLAYEVRQNDALLGALMRFAVVLRQTGQFDEALKYFRQMIHQAEIAGDQDAYAIGLQNLAHCYVGKHEIHRALEYLAKEKETCDIFHLSDLEADALKSFGHLLLLEGHLWEAEECYSRAYATTLIVEEKNHPNHSHQEHTFVLWAISAGMQLWSRVACLARTDRYRNLVALMERKNRRAPLSPAHLTEADRRLDLIEDIYIPFEAPPEEEVELLAEGSTDTLNRNDNSKTALGSSANIASKTQVSSTTNVTASTSRPFTWVTSTNTNFTARKAQSEQTLATIREKQPSNLAITSSEDGMRRKSVHARRVTLAHLAREQQESIQDLVEYTRRKSMRLRKSIVSLRDDFDTEFLFQQNMDE